MSRVVWTRHARTRSSLPKVPLPERRLCDTWLAALSRRNSLLWGPPPPKKDFAMAWLRKRWLLLLGSVPWIVEIVRWIRRLLEWGEHTEFVEHHFGDLKAIWAIIGKPPWWVNIPLLLGGLALIWLDLRRRYAGQVAAPTFTPQISVEMIGNIPNIRVADDPVAVALFEGKEHDNLLPLLEADKIFSWARPMGRGEPPLTMISGAKWKTFHFLFAPRSSPEMRNQTFL